MLARATAIRRGRPAHAEPKSSSSNSLVAIEAIQYHIAARSFVDDQAGPCMHAGEERNICETRPPTILKRRASTFFSSLQSPCTLPQACHQRARSPYSDDDVVIHRESQQIPRRCGKGRSAAITEISFISTAIKSAGCRGCVKGKVGGTKRRTRRWGLCMCVCYTRRELCVREGAAGKAPHDPLFPLHCHQHSLSNLQLRSAWVSSTRHPRRS